MPEVNALDIVRIEERKARKIHAVAREVMSVRGYLWREGQLQ